jgi:UDPglucose 6-dehydrogenase
MRLAVIGSGYVGLVAGACFAETGNDVVCMDADADKVARLRRNDIPIHEPGLESMVRRNQDAGRLRFTDRLEEAVDHARVIFIAVGTPPMEDGSADLSHVIEVARDLARLVREPTVVVTKSTVPVGTAAKVAAVLREHTDVVIEVCANPEFLKEGAAIEDFMRPDRVVVGTEHEPTRELMRELYAPFTRQGGERLIFMDPASAEVTKYAANAMLATRISFMNQVAGFCEAVGADVHRVRQGIGADHRIGRAFLYPGPGYGGSCFPKDVKALLRSGAEHGAPMELLAAVEAVNERQKRVLLEKVRRFAGPSLEGKVIGVWGLAFKAETDDVRESPALAVIRGLLDDGATVRAYDPHAMESARRVFGDRVAYAADPYEAASGADALVVVTEWLLFRTPDFDRLGRIMRRRLIIDGRNLYAPDRVAALGFEYHGIGRRQP